jgi:hypothetical protein
VVKNFAAIFGSLRYRDGLAGFLGALAFVSTNVHGGD